ncbi:probable starch synthase 4, chloroplastic/amyloplastic isoform X2 [Rutidosis leptorrhynchoides]|uniref:probable starch synthase 4, chloroplastic/amyloplastic isoform X2 n=1 Tax=Rutidosis leptorrhynchoides TaxID=125765 RepID=UPI003A99E838
MALKLSTSFLSYQWSCCSIYDCKNHFNLKFYTLRHPRLFTVACKMRQRNSSVPQPRRPNGKKIVPGQLPQNDNFVSDGSEHSDSENEEGTSAFSEQSVDTVAIQRFDAGNSSITLNQSVRADKVEKLSSVSLQDVIGMIRNAEKNVHILNQARIHAIQDLEKNVSEKEALQREINNLELRLAETDARIRIAAQDKIHMELLQHHLEKLQTNTSNRNGTHDIVLRSPDRQTRALSEELIALRNENMSLKDDLMTLKEQLNEVKKTDERVEILEKERTVLESSVKELEYKLTLSQDDVQLTTLRSEYETLWDKVEHLQGLLDKSTSQADQAILVLQQNQELRKKVESLEESLEDASIYKLSSEKLQQYNELMQQKIKLLDERLEKSDAEIHSYVQLYQDSVQEFQDTLDNLKEESKKKLSRKHVDMPWEFWSRMLLMIDAWFLEKKIHGDEAKLLREMTWQKDAHIHDVYIEYKDKSESEIIAAFCKLTSSSFGPGLHVIHIAAEMAPVAKVGGLGDVLSALSKALQKKGHLVEIVLPKYDCMQYESIQDLRVLDLMVESYFDGQLFKNKIWVGTVEGLPVYFIDPLHPAKFYSRGKTYGEHDDLKRFSFFSRAALELMHQAGKKPDIIHCHDWQTAFVAPLYWDLYAPKGLNSARICFTCHNFEYQGTAPVAEIASCGLDIHRLNRPDRMQDHSSTDRINPVKGAIVFSNIVTTVSPTYAQEVRTPQGGQGLHATLNAHAQKFVGILNGIDTDSWNPATDNCLRYQYNVNDLEGKTENKEALRRHLGLSTADSSRPLVGCITRLVPQKGVHLIRHAIYRAMELGGQFVLLGSSPVPNIHREFEEIANKFQTHDHVRLILKYDEALSHSIYAASDMFIIPSIFEPCGLTQMIAMRYGAIPIVRKTGGLNDSVFDVDDDTIPIQLRNGFTFVTPDEQGFNGAFDRAIKHYNNDIEGWQELVHKVMNIDFSWDTSASLYEELYQQSVAKARAARRAAG